MVVAVGQHKPKVTGYLGWLISPQDLAAVGYMRLLQDRTAATLMLIISAHVAPGMEVWSNQWASYHNVGTIPAWSYCSPYSKPFCPIGHR